MSKENHTLGLSKEALRLRGQWWGEAFREAESGKSRLVSATVAGDGVEVVAKVVGDEVSVTRLVGGEVEKFSS